MTLKTSQQEILKSMEFQDDLSNTLKEIKNDVYNHLNEAEIASVFENHIFSLTKNKLDMNIRFLKEATEKDLGFPFEGRIDMTQNSFLVEYKRPAKLNTVELQEKAMAQLESYLRGLDKNLSIETAIVTDGRRIGKIYLTDGVSTREPFREMDVRDFSEIVTSLVSSDSKKLSSRNIVEDFGLQGGRTVTPELSKELFGKLINGGETHTESVYREWLELFHLSESDTGKNQDIAKRREQLSQIFEVQIDDATTDYKALFALQTAYAIILKLIAAKLIGKLVLGKDTFYFSDLTEVRPAQLHSFLKRMEDGDSYNAQGVRNLLEGDFFSWYTFDGEWDETIANLIISVIKNIEEYSAVVQSKNMVATDIFKDLYIEIMPQAARHSLGEYYTPGWLADNVLNNSIAQIYNKVDWKGADPTCGSGIFLSTMISKILKEHGNLEMMTNVQKIHLRNEILSRVKGVDINPLNVLAARVSYLLSISPLLTGENDFEIPVYLGDSAITPSRIEIENEKCITKDISLSNFTISSIFPEKLVRSENFAKLLNKLKTVLRLKNSVILKDTLYRAIEAEGITISSELDERMSVMCEQLVELEKQNWNGLWLQVIGNYIKTSTISNIDIVIGNPPWVKWEFLPQKYAEKIKSVSLERHLFSGQTYMGAISLNICALIAHVTATSWLKKEGVLAFLMPKTIMTQDSYEGFRNFIINSDLDERFYLQFAEDWEKSGHPFVDMKDSFLSYYFKRDKVDYTRGVPIAYVTKRKGKGTMKMNEINERHLFNDVESQFHTEQGYLVNLDSSRSGFTFVKAGSQIENFAKIVGISEYKARSGVEFTPKEVYMLSFLEQSNESNKAIFENLKSKGTIHKVNQDGPLKIETKYVRPLIMGPSVGKFAIENRNQFCIFPYEMGEKTSVSLPFLLENSENLAEYLVKQKEVISGQSERSKAIAKGGDFYSLSKIGDYTYSPYRVVFRDNSKWAAAVSSRIDTPWEEAMLPIPAKHAPYISKTKKGRDIQEDEAHYVCAILNSPVVESYMLSTFSTRSISIDLKIKIPIYDKTNVLHKKLSALSKAITNGTLKLDDGLKQINKVYLSLCDELG
ncbi:hypothetical protein RAK27_14470 [Carnobacterium maltaromaticum]|uniref:site-specific DNA-methyltransferase (adenine-specific) n=1 Tax=Carnobacterium maltaromaticum TaxID=2751 RepID=A0AAW9JW71_CARML|nr:hypothetical protein [Carnobacterium maltaromaticum]MDZ5759863.1 hypothetical protein [Carnobacterium maltaromaticum]